MLWQLYYQYSGDCSTNITIFYNNLDNLYAFIEKNQYTHQHIIIEANALALAGKGDIIIYIDGDPDKINFRKDAAESKSVADIIVSTDTKESDCKQVLTKYKLDNFDQVYEILKQHLGYIKTNA